jgi:hypothetical protein
MTCAYRLIRDDQRPGRRIGTASAPLSALIRTLVRGRVREKIDHRCRDRRRDSSSLPGSKIVTSGTSKQNVCHRSRRAVAASPTRRLPGKVGRSRIATFLQDFSCAAAFSASPGWEMRDVALMAYVRPRVNAAERKSLTQGQGMHRPKQPQREPSRLPQQRLARGKPPARGAAIRERRGGSRMTRAPSNHATTSRRQGSCQTIGLSEINKRS